MGYIGRGDPTATISLDLAFESETAHGRAGARARSWCGAPNALMNYNVNGNLVEVLRVLHTTQQ